MYDEYTLRFYGLYYFVKKQQVIRIVPSGYIARVLVCVFSEKKLRV